MKKKSVSLLGLVALSVILLVCGNSTVWGEKAELTVISHRYPATEYYTKALGEEAPPGVKVTAELMPYPKYMPKVKIALSAGADTYDIIWTENVGLTTLASKGWLEPLDDYIQKYKDEFDFDDIPQSIWDTVTYKGKIYGIPLLVNDIFFFYRKDLFAEKGLELPKTYEEFVEVARKMMTEKMYGLSMTLKRPGPITDEYHCYLSGAGGTWLDENFKPTFNRPAGVIALQYMKRLMKYAPPGVLSYTNDESTVAMQQEKVAMMLQWATRAAPMDDASVSKVVGLVDWAVPPSLWEGGIPASKTSTDSFTISKFTKYDKDLIFRTIARATTKAVVRRGAEYYLPVRSSVVDDPQLIRENRYWEAAAKTIDRGAKPLPFNPDYIEFREHVAIRLAEALIGDLTVKEALDRASEEVYKFLKKKGYY